MKPEPGERTLEPHHRPAATGGDSVDAALAGAGDTAAYERLYHRHSGRIHGLAVRMMGIDEAEECTQEVFIRAWEKLGSFRGDAAFGTWLYRLGVNTILSMRAKRGRRQDRVMLAEDEVLEGRAGAALTLERGNGHRARHEADSRRRTRCLRSPRRRGIPARGDRLDVVDQYRDFKVPTPPGEDASAEAPGRLKGNDDAESMDGPRVRLR